MSPPRIGLAGTTYDSPRRWREFGCGWSRLVSGGSGTQRHVGSPLKEPENRTHASDSALQRLASGQVSQGHSATKLAASGSCGACVCMAVQGNATRTLLWAVQGATGEKSQHLSLASELRCELCQPEKEPHVTNDESNRPDPNCAKCKRTGPLRGPCVPVDESRAGFNGGRAIQETPCDCVKPRRASRP
jgi:hypothetical protein